MTKTHRLLRRKAVRNDDTACDGDSISGKHHGSLGGGFPFQEGMTGKQRGFCGCPNFISLKTSMFHTFIYLCAICIYWYADKMNNAFVSPFVKPVCVMMKLAGAICDPACDYCYYLEKKKLYPEVKNLVMSEQLLEKFIRKYLECRYIQFTPIVQRPPANVMQWAKTTGNQSH